MPNPADNRDSYLRIATLTGSKGQGFL